MSLNTTKHIVEEIDGVRCSIIEPGCSKERADFLQNLLQFNKYEVRTEENAQEGAASVYKVGVTDVTFNAVLKVYEKSLKRNDGHVVTPAFWDQKAEQTNIPYWVVK